MASKETKVATNKATAKDGYWFKSAKNESIGPLSKAKFERLRTSGVINSSTKVWRVALGNAYKCEIKREFVYDKMFSLPAMAQMFQLLTILLMSLLLLSLYFIIDWEKLNSRSPDKNKVNTQLIIGLSLIMIISLLFTMRRVYKRYEKVSTRALMSEV